jgi:hypothetical protein
LFCCCCFFICICFSAKITTDIDVLYQYRMFSGEELSVGQHARLFLVFDSKRVLTSSEKGHFFSNPWESPFMLTKKSIKFELDTMKYENIWGAMQKRGIIQSKCLIELPHPVYRFREWWWTSVQSFKVICQWTLKIFDVLKKNFNISG